MMDDRIVVQPRTSRAAAFLAVTVLSLFITCAAAQSAMDPQHVDAFVTPYYDSKGPIVRVGRFSAGLASRDEGVFITTIGQMKRQWPQLSFPELYVGAIRLYDRGYRYEAVYWFYTAQYRGRQLTMLLDPAGIGSIGNPAFELRAAHNAFLQSAGVWINGYAFGDIDALVEIIHRVQREQSQVPDLRRTYPHVAFVPQRQWAADNAHLAGGMNALVSYVQSNKTAIAKQRHDNGVAARFSRLPNKQLPQKM